MAGPAVDRSPWSVTTNVVVRCVPSPGIQVAEADRAVQAAGASVATALAGPTAGAAPDDVRTIGPPPPVDAALPAIAVILQVASEGPLLATFLDGEPLDEFAPHIFDERALHEGRLTNGAYDWPGVRTVTAVYQDLALLRELRAAHGAAAVRRPDPRPGLPRRRRPEAPRSRGLGRARRRARGRRRGVHDVLERNSHTDTMLTVQACERRGIGTVALVCETNGGLTDHVPQADCLVSTGNEDELVDAWTPERVVGGTTGRGSASGFRPCTTWGLVQTGDARWTAVPV